MGAYPEKAERQVVIDATSNIAAMMRQDAAGQLSYGSNFREIYPGDVWIDLLRAEPAFMAKVAPVLCDFVEDADPRRRELALLVMEKFSQPRFLRALRDAFEQDPSRFVGVDSPSGAGLTLFAKWLSALAVSAFKDREEYARASAVAKPFLELPEAGNYDYMMPMSLDEPFDAWLPQFVGRASDKKLEGMIYGVPPQQVATAASALARSPEDDRRRFAAAAKKYLRQRDPQNTALVHELDRNLGLLP